MTETELIELATEARKKSYSPYSHFAVGAALEAKNGEVFTGCNIENAGYTPANCAERTAFFKAVSEGVYGFKRIAIVGGKHATVAPSEAEISIGAEKTSETEKSSEVEKVPDYVIDAGQDLGLCAPCGVCRQVMMEFCRPEEFEILLGERHDGKLSYSKYFLKDLLALGFGPLDLGMGIRE